MWEGCIYWEDESEVLVLARCWWCFYPSWRDGLHCAALSIGIGIGIAFVFVLTITIRIANERFSCTMKGGDELFQGTNQYAKYFEHLYSPDV